MSTKVKKCLEWGLQKQVCVIMLRFIESLYSNMLRVKPEVAEGSDKQ